MKPRLLDLFCGGGGAAMGYHRAGFEVHGVDHVEQPDYPFDFTLADAHDYPLDGFDAIHASPPCHDHAAIYRRNQYGLGVDQTGWQLGAVLDRLRHQGAPWIVENVETAVLPPDVYRVRLCGSAFGLEVRRHRWFASNVALLVPPCQHHAFRNSYPIPDNRGPGTSRVVPVHGHLNYPGDLDLRQRAMGIDWLPNETLTQAIPPAYTELLGAQLLDAVRT